MYNFLRILKVQKKKNIHRIQSFGKILMLSDYEYNQRICVRSKEM